MEGFRGLEGRSWDQAERQPGEQSRHAGDAPLRSRLAVALGCRGGAGVVGSVGMWVMPHFPACAHGTVGADWMMSPAAWRAVLAC